MARTRTAPRLADTTPSVAGVAIHDPRYAKAGDPYLPEGTLICFMIRLGHYDRTQRQRWEADLSWRDCALVQIDGVNMDTRTVRSWSIGLDGWLPGLSFPTAEDAVRALGKSGMVAKLRKLTAEYHAVHKAEQEARIRVLRHKAAALDLAEATGAVCDYAWEADQVREHLAVYERIEAGPARDPEDNAATDAPPDTVTS